MTKFVITLSLSAALFGLVSAPSMAQISAPESYNSSLPKTDAHTRARLHTELASMYLQADNMAVALEECGIAVDSDQSYAPAYGVRALTYMMLREFDAAEKDFKRAISLAPTDPEINNNYGWFLCERGRAKESVAYFLTAVKNPLYSTPEKAYANAGACAMRAGDLEGATAYLQQAVRLSPDSNPNIALLLSKLAYMKGNLSEARAGLLRVIGGSQRPSAEALWLGARIERKLGNRADEGSMVAQLQRLYPSSPEYQEFLKGNYE